MSSSTKMLLGLPPKALLSLAFTALLGLCFAGDADAARRSKGNSASVKSTQKAKVSAKSKLNAKSARKSAKAFGNANPAGSALTAATLERPSPTGGLADEQRTDSSSVDATILDARRAFVNGDHATIAQAVNTLSKNEHLLAEYPRYWQLVLALRASTANPLTDSAAEKFLERSSNRLLIDALRGEWITSLARRQRWSTAREQGQRLLARDDRAVQCYVWLADLMETGELAVSAREHLLSPRELGEGCNPLLGAASARKVLSRDELLLRLRLSAESGALATGRRTAALLSLDSADFTHALRAPGYLLKKGSRDTEPLVMALALLARNEPEEAAAHLSALTLPADTSQFVWAVIAAQGAQRLLPQAIEWTRRGIDARVSDETRGWMARSALAAGDWSLLQKLILGMSDTGQQEPAWIYWLARAHREFKQDDRATHLLQTIAGQWNFYGHLAADELGLSIDPPEDPAAFSAAETAEAGNNPAFARARKFYALGYRADGNREWNFALRGMTDRQLLAAADLACKAAILDRCVNTADRTRYEHSLALRFLTPFRERMAVFAKEQGLDPAWVYGLIRQESRFLYDARSHAGAQGLMQIMPKTGSWIARQLGVNGFTTRDLHDIDTNLRFGTFYLRDVSNRLEQSEVMASAAYNAGPGRPARWRGALNTTMDGAAFAEIIPFNETRDYVKKVMWNATWYATVFSGKPQSLKQRLGQIGPRIDKLTRQNAADPD